MKKRTRNFSAYLDKIYDRLDEYKKLADNDEIDKVDYQAFEEFVRPIIEWGEREIRRIKNGRNIRATKKEKEEIKKWRKETEVK